MTAIILHGPRIAALGLAALSLTANQPEGESPPRRFSLYHSGPPCLTNHIDKTFAQFQVNLGPGRAMFRGRLRSGSEGEALLVDGAERAIRLHSNASMADWLLTYPHATEDVAVWGRQILRSDCSVVEGSLYVDALFPFELLGGPIGNLDLMARTDQEELMQAASRYRSALRRGRRGGKEPEQESGGRWGAAGKLVEALFTDEAASAIEPWRVRLLGTEEVPPGTTTIDILLSGSDGSTGMFGHFAVGGSGQIYNVYPKGSPRGVPGPVPLWDFLFNAERGQALRRPTWLLRLGGLSEEVVTAFHREMDEETEAISAGRNYYHPTSNN
jgi:hypothetical protein